MAKKLIKLTEADLRNIVKESVNKILIEHDMYALGRESVVNGKRVIKEGSTSQEAFNYWDDIKEMLGADKMIMELWNWLDSDSIDGFIQHIDRNYDLGLFDEPELDDEEEFEDEEGIY